MSQSSGPAFTVKLSEPASGDIVQQFKDVTVKEPQALPQLTADEKQQMERSLPPLAVAEKKEFAVRESSLRPPVASEHVAEPFPPPTDAPAPHVEAAAEGGQALTVVRWAPDGMVPLAPHFSITFSHAMVPLTSLHSIAATTVPLQLSPSVEGKFRWIGDKTLLFEPQYRFAQATVYTATVPKGTTSLDGSVTALAEDFESHFQTARPTVEETWKIFGFRPVFLLQFNQAVDAAKVGPKLKLLQLDGESKVQASEQFAPKVITADVAEKLLSEEVARNPSIEWDMKQLQNALRTAPAERLVAFHIDHPLPPATQWVIEVGPGVPSAEGPLESESAYEVTFESPQPMKITGCSPTSPDFNPPQTTLSIYVTNSIDLDLFQDSYVVVTPPIEDQEIEANSTNISIRGKTKGRTTYKVELDPAIQDCFGQKLGPNDGATFEVGSCNPLLRAFAYNDNVVLDPNLPAKGDVLAKSVQNGVSFAIGGPPAPKDYSMVVVNVPQLDICLVSTDPSKLDEYREIRNSYGTPPEEILAKFKALGTVVCHGVVDTNCEPDVPAAVHISLDPALKDGVGHIIAYVAPVMPKKEGDQPPESSYDLQSHNIWIQCTNLALSMSRVPRLDYYLVTSLKDGHPIAGAEISVGSFTTVTDVSGLASLPGNPDAGQLTAVVRLGGDSTFEMQPYTICMPSACTMVYTFDDRKLYKPKETAHIKGIVRRCSFEGSSRALTLPATGTSVSYTVQDPRGQEIGKGTTELNEFGAFHVTVSFPDNANLGNATVLFKVDGSEEWQQSQHTLKLQEFRRPEFQVTCTSPEGHQVGRGSAVLTAQAAYFAGGPLAGVNVSWNVRWSTGRFSPKGWSGFAFQEARPPWLRCFESPDPEQSSSFQANTDCNGRHKLCLNFAPSIDAKIKKPSNVNAEATVQDITYQSMSASAEFILHPGQYYVGVKCAQFFIPVNAPAPLQFVVCTVDGDAVANVPIALTCTKQQKTKGRQVKTEEVECWKQEHVSTDKALDVPLTFAESGAYTVTAEVVDPNGLVNHCQLFLIVTGAGPSPLPINDSSPGDLFIPDKGVYQPGETAHITIRSPLEGQCWGFAQVGCMGLLKAVPLEIAGHGSQTISIDIDESHIPNLSLAVVLAGTEAVDGSLRPKYVTDYSSLTVSKDVKTFSIAVQPASQYLAPGGETDVTVAVTTLKGDPVTDAEVALWVVDEAVLLLAGYSLEASEPLDLFFPNNTFSSQNGDSRSKLLVPNWKDIQFSSTCQFSACYAMEKCCYAAMACPMACYDGGFGGPPPMIAVRSNFDALACFHATLHTSDAGTCTAAVKLPDNLTKYRVFALAVKGAAPSFGVGTSSIEAALPINVRPSFPRFLNVGDQAEFTVVVQNQTDSAVDVAVLAQVSNLHLLPGSDNGFQLHLQPHQRSDVRFQFKTEVAGTAVVQVGARVISGPVQGDDAATGHIPVWTPATAEAFATYGEVDNDGQVSVHSLSAPSDVYPQYGGLQVSTSSTILQSLTDAFVYLAEYPYDCVEQTASKLMGLVLLRDVQEAFGGSKLPQGEALNKEVQRLLKKLRTAQRSDGSFGFWTSQSETNPYVTLHVAHCLAVTAQKNFDGPLEILSQLVNAASTLGDNLSEEYSKEIQWALRSKACYVQTLLAKIEGLYVDAGKAQSDAKELWSTAGGLKGLDLESAAFLAYAVHQGPEPGPHPIVQEFLAELQNRAEEVAGRVHFVEKYSDAGAGKLVLLHSRTRVDAVCLEVLQVLDSSNVLISKVARGLLGGRKRGRWNSTQENVFSLAALDRYFHSYESATPDFKAYAWLDQSLLAEHSFQGRETKTSVTDVPMEYLVKVKNDEPQPLLVQKVGAGRLYYRLGLTYSPLDLTLGALNCGFVVQRSYEAIKEPSDVEQTPTGYSLRVGSMVRVKLTVEVQSLRYHVALVDKLPACLEPLNADLGGTSQVARNPEERCWWGRWYEHSNLRDERVEAFASRLYAGAYTYSYVASVTAVGDFVVPPATAEEMYSPEVFGRSPSMKVNVH